MMGPLPHFLCYEVGTLFEYYVLWDSMPVNQVFYKMLNSGIVFKKGKLIYRVGI